jgi:outer membrane protease
MRTIYAFSLLVSSIYIFFPVLPAAGETERPPKAETAYALSAAPVFGVLYGEAEELVYKPAGSDALLSQLIWEIKPLLLVGASLDFSRRYPLEKPGFLLNVTGQFSSPLKTGIMEDRDWMASGDRLSHFSSHDNYTDRAMLFDVTGGLSWPIQSRLLIKAYVFFNYTQFRWVGRDGYYQYGALIGGVYSPWNNGLAKKAQSGPVIYYTQNWFILSPGFSLYIPWSRFFAATVDLRVSPLVYCLDQDNHILTGVQYNDYMFGGIFFEPKGEFVFSLNKKIDLSVYGSYRLIKQLRGYIIEKNLSTDKTTTAQDQAGAAYSALGGGLSVKIRF